MIQCCKQIKAHVEFQFNYETSSKKIDYMDQLYGFTKGAFHESDNQNYLIRKFV